MKKPPLQLPALAVDIELESTWPKEFRAEAHQHRSLIFDYQRERREIDEESQNNVTARIFPPPNHFKRDYEALVSRLEPMLKRHQLVGYHCTCLTSSEIALITAAGMRPLSAELIREKFEKAVSDGHLTRTQADLVMRHEYQVGALGDRFGHRTGMTWFCANRSTLTEPSGVYRLFRYWGGEATRGGPQGHPDILRAIMHIGTSCIVKCAIPFGEADRYGERYSERFLSQSVASEFRHPEPSPLFNFHVKANVAASNVLKVIEYTDPEFERLTRCSGWPERDSIDPKYRDKWVEEESAAPASPPTPRSARTVYDLSDEELEMIAKQLDDQI